MKREPKYCLASRHEYLDARDPEPGASPTTNTELKSPFSAITYYGHLILHFPPTSFSFPLSASPFTFSNGPCCARSFSFASRSIRAFSAFAIAISSGLNLTVFAAPPMCHKLVSSVQGAINAPRSRDWSLTSSVMALTFAKPPWCCVYILASPCLLWVGRIVLGHVALATTAGAVDLTFDGGCS